MAFPFVVLYLRRIVAVILKAASGKVLLACKSKREATQCGKQTDV
jgi:hypothetical protein